MAITYGIGIRKGGQCKSTTASTLARLLAHYGARVLVADQRNLAQRPRRCAISGRRSTMANCRVC